MIPYQIHYKSYVTPDLYDWALLIGSVLRDNKTRVINVIKDGKTLFEAYPTPKALAACSLDELKAVLPNTAFKTGKPATIKLLNNAWIEGRREDAALLAGKGYPESFRMFIACDMSVEPKDSDLRRFWHQHV